MKIAVFLVLCFNVSIFHGSMFKKYFLWLACTFWDLSLIRDALSVERSRQQGWNESFVSENCINSWNIWNFWPVCPNLKIPCECSDTTGHVNLKVHNNRQYETNRKAEIFKIQNCIVVWKNMLNTSDSFGLESKCWKCLQEVLVGQELQYHFSGLKAP